MPNVAERHMRGELTGEERQANRDAAKRRVDLKKAREGAAYNDPAKNLQERCGSKSDWNRQKSRLKTRAALDYAMAEDVIITREFAEAMLAVFDTGQKYMSIEHVDNRHTQLDRAIRTGIMIPDLKPLFERTKSEYPEIQPHPEHSEEPQCQN